MWFYTHLLLSFLIKLDNNNNNNNINNSQIVLGQFITTAVFTKLNRDRLQHVNRSGSNGEVNSHWRTRSRGGCQAQTIHEIHACSCWSKTWRCHVGILIENLGEWVGLHSKHSTSSNKAVTQHTAIVSCLSEVFWSVKNQQKQPGNR